MTETNELQRLEDLLGRVLVTGVVASATILALGLAIDLFGGNGHAVLRLGLILLMATPVLRVIVSLVEYTRLRDWFFSATTAAVLLVLLTSIGLAILR
jgi:uncharacterized membrane protein